MDKILVINGPNLNLLGEREPHHYGKTTLESINRQLSEIGNENGYEVLCYQSNAEHELVDRIQKAAQEHIKFIIFNPAAFTHTSIALRDALLAVNLPFIEVHLSNIHQREAFRSQSYFSDIATGVITGLGALGYTLALNAAIQHLFSKME